MSTEEVEAYNEGAANTILYSGAQQQSTRDSAVGTTQESSQRLGDMTLADLTGVLKAALVNPPIPDFSFTGRTSVSGYLTKLQDFFLMHSVPERKKFPIALATLRREALNWFELIAKKDILKEPEYFRFGKLKRMLESTFGPPQDFQLENELYTRIQKVGEPLTQFLVRKLEILDLLGKSDSDEEKFGLILPRLLPEIQETIEMRNIATVSELYSFSQRYDSRRSRYNDRGFQPGIQGSRYNYRGVQPVIQEKTVKNTNFSSKPVTDQKYGSRSSFQPENRPRGFQQPQRLSANSTPPPNLNRVSVTTSDLPFIFLQIEGRTIKCLLDSGSETCLISSSCYFANFRNIRYSPSPISVTTADGTRRKVRGSVKLQLASGQEVIKWNFLILNELESSVILGADLLVNASAILNFKKKSVSWELEKPKPLEPVDLSTLDLPLVPDQKASAVSVVQNVSSLCTAEPDLTNEGAHEIKVTTEKPIRTQPYRDDSSKEKFVADDLSRTTVEGGESVKGSTAPQSPHLPAETLSPRSSLSGDQAASSGTELSNASTHRNPRFRSQEKATPAIKELAPPKKPCISSAEQPSPQHGQRQPTWIPINSPAQVKRPRVTSSHEEQISGPKLRPRSVRDNPPSSPPRGKTRRPKLNTQPVSPPTESPQASTSAYPQRRYLGPTSLRHCFVQPVKNYKKRRTKKR